MNLDKPSVRIHPTGKRRFGKVENRRKFDQERGEVVKGKRMLLPHWTERIAKGSCWSFIQVFYDSVTSPQYLWFVIMRNNVNPLISVLWIQRFFGLEISEAFFGSFEMTWFIQTARHDMRKGHTLFCILKYIPKNNSGSGGLRELIQSYGICCYKSKRSSRNCFKIWRLEQIHHPSWQPKAAEAAEHETGHDKMEAEAHHEEEWLVHFCWCGSQLSQLAWYICLYSFIIEL